MNTSNQSQIDDGPNEGAAAMLRSAQVVSGMIFAYWIGFIGLFIGGVAKLLPEIPMPAGGFYSLFYIYVGGFPVMLLCVGGLWRRRPRYAKCCLGITLSLGILTYLSTPTVVG